MSTTNTVELDGLKLYITATFEGGKPWPSMPSNRNNNRLTIEEENGISEDFEIWSSNMKPKCFDGSIDGPFSAFSLICQEAWTYINEEIEDILFESDFEDYYDYLDARQEMENLLKDMTDSLYNLGLADDDILFFANSEDNYETEVSEEDGVDARIIFL